MATAPILGRFFVFKIKNPAKVARGFNNLRAQHLLSSFQIVRVVDHR